MSRPFGPGAPSNDPPAASGPERCWLGEALKMRAKISEMTIGSTGGSRTVDPGRGHVLIVVELAPGETVWIGGVERHRSSWVR